MSTNRLRTYSALDRFYTEESKFLTTVQRKHLLESLQMDLRPEYRRRIEIMLLADMGYSQAQICAALGCSKETARYWIAMTQAGKADNWNENIIGRPTTVNEQYLERLKELVSSSPREYGYSFRCWTAGWLSKHLTKEFGIAVSDRHINRLLKKLGLSTRPRRSGTETVTHGSKNYGINIGDLPSSSPSSFLWSSNFIKFGS